MSRLLTPGTDFGPFRIGQPIARGARRVVYEAQHRARDEHVSLLVLRDATPAEARRFQRDATRLRRLRHPCLPPIVDVGEADGHPYLAARFVEGEALASALKDGPPAWEWSARILARLAHGLARCHHAGIGAHDLTPADIVVHDDQPVLVGFALIGNRRLGAGSHPGFLAPEVHAKDQTPSPATDVYALGAALYYLLTGAPPFEGPDRKRVIHDVLEADPPDPRDKNPDVPEALSAICRRALAKQPAERHASAELFARALEAVAD